MLPEQGQSSQGFRGIPDLCPTPSPALLGPFLLKSLSSPALQALATRQPQGNNPRTSASLPAALNHLQPCSDQHLKTPNSKHTQSSTTSHTSGINPKKDHKISSYIKKYRAKNFFCFNGQSTWAPEVAYSDFSNEHRDLKQENGS